MTFTIPLPEREVAGIAKSVHAIQERNRRSGRQQAGLSRIQASRGEGGGKKSGEVQGVQGHRLSDDAVHH